ncbi:hypothetical protein A3K93_09860 [Acinetobacter sp. NCu2D-2]|uniref:hypothetical protein n=1 Tax=Acinetobacter sp. NCu2D-2 TaxID=1608473 RepID=UPI0007CDEA66|nr:hypothetical protein [Acinetobacter sp. NCu2D-2]ANF82467.1 hypothetical protein A3K93_09860 [Acinetobacter sp. NCu2D-2]
MRVEIVGLNETALEIDLAVIPREGEYLRFVDDSGNEIEAEIAAITHYIHTSTQKQRIKIELRPIN